MAKVVKVGPFGGSGGEIFDMGAACQLLEIKIRSVGVTGGPIQGLTITYLENGICKSFQIGAPGGVENPPIVFKAGEFIVEVSGSFGPPEGFTVIQSLRFRTNRDTYGPYGPYGPEVGIFFSVPVLNAKIVGFFGRAKTLVDAIGVNIVPTCCGLICGPKC